MRKLKPSQMGICSVKDCGETTIASGWCYRHYTSNRKYGSPTQVDDPAHIKAMSRKRGDGKIGKPGYWLGKKRGPWTEEHKSKISASNLGKPKSLEHRANIAKSRVGQNHLLSTIRKIAKTRKKVAKKGRDHHSWGVPPARGRRYEYNGKIFRSTYEVRFAKACDRLGIKWTYEKTKFDLGTCTYRPDFYLPDTNMYWEIKGWLGPDSIRKTSLFRDVNPDISLVVATEPVLRQFEAMK